MSKGRFPDDWFNKLKLQIQSKYFKNLRTFILEDRKKFNIFPAQENIFRAFIETPFDKVKVVILGKEPYNKRGQAHGLAFSVQDGISIPPILKNIFTELNHDLELEIPNNGNLTEWSKRGIFLLNSILTVREAQSNSHKEKGWETFTDSVIKMISDEKDEIVFILWGDSAEDKDILIDESKHFIIKAPHPSPLSSYRGFFNSLPFSKTNKYLQNKNRLTINWKISSKP